VVLPVPLGPMMAVTAPRAMSRSRPSNSLRPPKREVRPRTRTSGVTEEAVASIISELRYTVRAATPSKLRLPGTIKQSGDQVGMPGTLQRRPQAHGLDDGLHRIQGLAENIIDDDEI